MSRPHLVLVGAGHAHLHAISRARDIVRRGIDLTLVAPGPFVYSSYTAATVGSRRPPAQGRIDTAARVTASGGSAIDARAERVDATKRSVLLDDDTELSWDAISLDVGSHVPADRIPGSADHAFRVKPYREMRALDTRLDERLGAGLPTDVLIMGGGASAVELAGNLEARLRRAPVRTRVRLVAKAPRLIEDMPVAAAERVARYLRARGVEIHTNRTLTRVDAGLVVDSAGGTLPFDLLIDATGLEPEDLARRSGLPHVNGALLVDAHLCSTAGVPVFGGGDAVRLVGFEQLRPAGVHAVRQGPVLLHNLLATLERRPLRAWGPPPAKYLAILDLGAGYALAVRGDRVWLGRGARLLKDAIDARFVRRHR